MILLCIGGIDEISETNAEVDSDVQVGCKFDIIPKATMQGNNKVSDVDREPGTAHAAHLQIK